MDLAEAAAAQELVHRIQQQADLGNGQMHSILLSAKDMGASQVLSSGLATQNMDAGEERPQRLQTDNGVEGDNEYSDAGENIDGEGEEANM